MLDRLELEKLSKKLPVETAGEIVTCVFEKEEVRFTREWSSKECEENGEADRCYSLQRGAV